MFIKVTDADRQTIVVNSANIAALVIPSPLSGGDGKCRLMVGPVPVVSILDREEATRISDLLKAE